MEGFGLPPLEAMAYGTPVVSSNASCMPEVLGDAARYFSPIDIHDMATAVERVITDETLRSAMVQRGYEQVKYSWEKMARETRNISKSSRKKLVPVFLTTCLSNYNMTVAAFTL